jgi:hypothetical protein
MSPDLVEQFRDSLHILGFKLEPEIYDGKFKVFGAERVGRSIIILAHESDKIGFWGVGMKHVQRLRSVAEENSLGCWGAVLIDRSSRRGFWIEGSNIESLADSLTRRGYFLFHDAKLARNRELAHYFFSVEEFLRMTGFIGPERIEISGEICLRGKYMLAPDIHKR